MESLNLGSGSSEKLASPIASSASGTSASASASALVSPIGSTIPKATQIYNLQTYVDGLSKKYNDIDDNNLFLTKEELKNLKLLFESHEIIVKKYIGKPGPPGFQV